MTKAFVLCGGKGTRLRPYTYSLPKPMLPLGNRPILEFVIDNLRHNGITDLILTVGYLKERIYSHFGDGSKFGVKITYSEETEELNTAGSLLPKKSLATGETFAVVMGDHLTNVSISKLLSSHKKSGCIATIGLKRMGFPLEYGVAHLEGKRISRFEEKPILENLVNTGVYAFEPAIFDYIRPKDDFALHVFPSLLSSKKQINPYIFEDYWMDIGRMEDYEHINKTISIMDIVLRRTKGEY